MREAGAEVSCEEDFMRVVLFLARMFFAYARVVSLGSRNCYLYLSPAAVHSSMQRSTHD
jgi:hypothetical protein